MRFRPAVLLLVALNGPATAQLVGPLFRVNSYATGGQYGSHVAFHPDGRYVVVWYSEPGGGSRTIQAQRFSASGAPLGPEFRVSTGTSAVKTNLSVASRNDRFLVVWGVVELSGRLFGWDGPAFGAEFRVNATTTGNQDLPSASPGDGGFVVVWGNVSEMTALPWGVYARRFDAAGAPLTDDFRLSTYTSSSPTFTAVSSSAAGGFVALWRDPTGLNARRFHPGGAPAGNEFFVASPVPLGIDLAVAPDGAFVVAAVGGASGDPGGYDVFGIHYSSSGTPDGFFRTNTYTTGEQSHPQVAFDPTGSFLVTWTNPGPTGTGQLFAPSTAPLGGEFTVSPLFIPGDVAGASGTFVVVGQSYDDVFGQRVSPPPLPIGGEFRVNSTTGGANLYPSVVEDATGAFAVAWHGAAAVNGFAFRRFSAGGSPLGSQLDIPADNTGSFVSSLASDSAGGFVLVWDQIVLPDVTLDVYAQRISSSGDALSTPFRVNTSTAQAHSKPWAAPTAGGFVVVWTGDAGDGSGKAVLGRRFASSGTPMGGEFVVNSRTAGDQQYATVASNASGGFVVAWHEGNVVPRDVYARRFGSSGSPIGVDFRVNTHTGPLTRAAVATDDDGLFVVAWDSSGLDGSNTGIAAQIFHFDTPTGPEFTVNRDATGAQSKPSVSIDPYGRFVVAWQSAIGTGYGVFEQAYDSYGALLGGTFRVNSATSSTARPSVALGKTWVTAWDQSNGAGGADIRALLVRPPCRTADANASGSVDVADVLYLINSLFAGGPSSLCDADADCSGTVNVGDVLYLINFLFAGGPEPGVCH